MKLIDWAALMRRGMGPVALGGLGLTPEAFWRLSPIELKVMLGLEGGAVPTVLGRKGLAALMAAYPDAPARQPNENGGGDDRD